MSLAEAAPVARPQTGVAVAFSAGIRALRHLPALLDLDGVASPEVAHRLDLPVSAVLVWGRKRNATAALEYARNRDLPVLYLEDGWIRSSAENAHSRICYSLLVDSTGVYYDSRTPSSIETLLNLDDERFARHCTPEELAYAAACRASLVANNVTKYNYCSAAVATTTERPMVLVVDQTRDDASVLHGGMDAERFDTMLNTAIIENPGCDVVVRTHPDVAAGSRKGYLRELAMQLDVQVSSGNENPLALVKAAKCVYVGTSQLGYEALLCERPVVVFGQPFYAGWGLTDDRQPLARRTQQRSIDQLFHASHVVLARYCNPVTGQRWQLHECIEHVKLQRSLFERNARQFHCVGIAPWKRRYIEQYLRSPDGAISFKAPPSFAPHVNQRVVTWGFRRHAPSSPEPAGSNTAAPLDRPALISRMERVTWSTCSTTTIARLQTVRVPQPCVDRLPLPTSRNITWVSEVR